LDGVDVLPSDFTVNQIAASDPEALVDCISVVGCDDTLLVSEGLVTGRTSVLFRVDVGAVAIVVEDVFVVDNGSPSLLGSNEAVDIVVIVVT